ncbi:heavy-metal-associated domain-containing protein [Spirosoma fluminis]
METLTFKTNIKCAACVATVTPFLNQAVGEGHWRVDTQNPNKVLTVETGSEQEVRQALEKAGYKAELLA